MPYGVRLRVWGERACFTRPEMKVERVSYDVMTPSAARGILEAIHWKPAIRWAVRRLHVLKPVRFESIRRNEVELKASAGLAERAMRSGSTDGLGIAVDEARQQRAATILRDVDYVIEAEFALTGKATADETPGKHLDIFNRRARRGQCFHQPCLGTREFPAAFALLDPGEPVPVAHPGDRDALTGTRDLGWMLLDIDHANGATSRFFRAEMRDGVIEVPAWDSADVRA
ncbi:type I-C CRISPR-associated protein Cas5c [Marinivivus vitaminiproducens]|uniref:type I-C CRISPR-associated protein Cas5c n=1 Tax=Marinivivus vitaminiproducens TaxID=3035935 RepID=UPI00279F8404|nr:type I-C CRISPR-associated protein Cas5c [Geminicoccaceae bacterium SCSIO 64248]